MDHRDHRDTRDWILLIIGVAIVWAGARLLLGWVPALAPLQELFRLIRNIMWPLLLIGGGILLILFSTRREMFTRPDGRKLYRSRDDRVITGVLGGLAEYLGWNPTLLRVLFVVGAIVTDGGFFILAYLIASIAIPDAPPAGTVIPPQWPQTPGSYTPPPMPPQPYTPAPPYTPPSPGTPPPSPAPPAPPSVPPSAPSHPEVPAPGIPVPPGQSYPPQAAEPSVPPSPPAPPTAPSPDEPTTPSANG